MKLENFYKTKKIRTYIKACLINMNCDLVKNYWSESKNFDEFKQKILKNKELYDEFGFWQFAKEQEEYINVLNSYLYSKYKTKFITISDSGSLKIGSSEFNSLIPNLYGDGENIIYVLDHFENLYCASYLTQINGTFRIYTYDSGESNYVTLTGKYWIYREQGIFIFVKDDRDV